MPTDMGAYFTDPSAGFDPTQFALTGAGGLDPSLTGGTGTDTGTGTGNEQIQLGQLMQGIDPNSPEFQQLMQLSPALMQDPGLLAALGAGAPNLGGGLGSVLQGLGLGSGSLGSALPGLLGLLGPLLGGLYAQHQTGQATSQVVNAINNANQQVQHLLGGPSLFQPYTNAGAQALQKAQGMGWTPLNYGPLGGQGVNTLGNLGRR